MTIKEVEMMVWVVGNELESVNQLLRETREYEEALETLHIYNGVKHLSVEQLNRVMKARTIIKYTK